MAGRGTTRWGDTAPEFFSWLPLGAVALFALNNFWLKALWPSPVTGKLSDVLACFFLPLFVSALLALTTNWSLRQRMAVGIALTAVALVSVKTSPLASSWLDAICAGAGSAFGQRFAQNVVDPSDLVALPLIAVSWIWARSFTPVRSHP